MTLARWIARHAQHQPAKIALRFAGREWRYDELNTAIETAAAALRSGMGLKRGDRIAFWGHNSAAQIILLFAAAREGMIFVPVNWRLAVPEIGFILKDCDVSAVFVDEIYAEALRELGSDLPTERVVILGDGESAMSFADFLSRHAGEQPAAAAAPEGTMEDPLLIVYTSGTTGSPKGAVLTQNALKASALNSIHMHDMTGDDHALAVLPMFHVGGLSIHTLPIFKCGGTVTLHARFEPDATLAEIARSRPSLMVVVPAIARALAAQEGWNDLDITCLRCFTTGSTDVPVPLIRQFNARGVPMIQCYGATETGPTAVYIKTDQADARIGSIGLPGPHCEVRIVDESGTDLAPGETGEILIRGAAVLRNYWRNPEATNNSFTGDWFHTGDMARRDEDGYLWFADRIKHVIISGGENIYPAELERVLNEMPSVAEAVVVGRADAKWGEVPVAVVVRRDSSLDTAAVLAAFEDRLARFKHPKDVVFVDALPRNAMGKVVVADTKALIEDSTRGP